MMKTTQKAPTCVRPKFTAAPHPTLKRANGEPVMVYTANTRIASGSRVKQLRRSKLKVVAS